MAEYIERETAINAVYEAYADGESAYDALIALPAADLDAIIDCYSETKEEADDMILRQGLGEKDGKLCFLEMEAKTGKCHYYPIRARVEITFSPNMPMFLPDQYLYVDRENEI